ncbi:MAG: dUTP diphosphatase [Deltaproteobacteria bacterium]|nr:MAG: dUTP diphosphatase [Deltaproteobacteria bacterium]
MTAPLAVDVVRVRPGRDPLPLPRYMTPGAAGMDLLADLEAEIVLAPGDRRLVPTGLAVAIPAGFEGQVRARSGLAARDGLTVLNGPGTIDADYRGEVRVLLVNLGRQPVSVRHGDRIAQLVIGPVARVVWREVATLPESVRGAGGFGSTGDPGQRSVRDEGPGGSRSEAEPSPATGSGAERSVRDGGVGGSPSEAEPSRATGSGAIGGAQRAERASTGRGPGSD